MLETNNVEINQAGLLNNPERGSRLSEVLPCAGGHQVTGYRV